MADAEGLNAPAGTMSTTAVARLGRSAGGLRPWHAGSEPSKYVGSPRRSWTGQTLEEDLPLLRHRRGNPETEPCWTLRSTVDHGPGTRSSPVTGQARRRRMGCRITPSPQRGGKAHDRGQA